jgi:two-component system, OmpR family, sensor histidine kinase KdpD
VAVCISANPTARDLIARGARLAEGMDAEFFVLHLDSERDSAPDAALALADNVRFAEDLGAKVVRLNGTSVATSTAEFAKQHRITQVIFGRSALTGLKKYLYFMAIQQFVSAAPHVDLHIITQESR